MKFNSVKYQKVKISAFFLRKILALNKIILKILKIAINA